MTTATQTPPEHCPVCGMGKDWTDTADGRAIRVAYMCGAKWALYNAHRVPLSPPEWVSDCSHAMDAALRCGATLHQTPRELARDKVVVESVARWLSMPDHEPIKVVDFEWCLAVRALYELEQQP